MARLGPLDALSRVVVRLPNALGDCVMASASLKRLAQIVTPENLVLVGSPSNLALLEGNPWSTSSIEYDRKGKHRGLGGFLATCRKLREVEADLCVLLPNSWSTALMALCSGAKARLGYYREGRQVLLTHGRKRDADRSGAFQPKYTGSYFLELLDLVDGLEPIAVHPQLFCSERGNHEYAAWRKHVGLEDAEPYMIVVPGASFGPSKIWLAERYAEVCRRLCEKHRARVFVSTGPGEEEVGLAVLGAIGEPALPQSKLSLHGLKSVFANAAFVLTNDTGPRHMAVAFDVPNVTIMGPVDPAYSFLESERGEIVREAVECSPCGKKVCPLGEQVCMTQLTTSKVLDACLRMWP